MKNLILSTLLVFTVFITFGQKSKKVKPVWNQESNQITVNGKYYASMEKKPSDILTGKDWWVSNVDGDIIIQFKTESYQNVSLSKDKKDYLGRPVQEESTAFRVQIIFPETGSYLHLSSTPLGMGAKQVMKKITKNELITNGQLDWKKAVMFIEGNGGRVFKDTNRPAFSNTPVTIDGNDILQDGKTIGKVGKRETTENFEYNIYNNDGVKVITASIAKENPFEWVVVDANGKEQTMLYQDDPNAIKVITYLAKSGSLK